MTSIEKALLTKELSKASAALHRAFAMARNNGNLDLANSLRRQQKALADEITTLNGGPVRITGSELLQ